MKIAVFLTSFISCLLCDISEVISCVGSGKAIRLGKDKEDITIKLDDLHVYCTNDLCMSIYDSMINNMNLRYTIQDQACALKTKRSLLKTNITLNPTSLTSEQRPGDNNKDFYLE